MSKRTDLDDSIDFAEKLVKEHQDELKVIKKYRRELRKGSTDWTIIIMAFFIILVVLIGVLLLMGVFH